MICAVVLASSLNEILEQGKQAVEQGAGLIEYRLDGLETIDYDKLKILLKEVDHPVILSIRSQWNNRLLNPPLEGRRETLLHLIDLEPDYLDLEFPIDMTLLKEIKKKTRPIISIYDFEGMAKIALDEVIGIHDQKFNNPIIKISAMPNSVNDLMDLWRWSRKLGKMDIDHVVLGMGQLGQITRIKSRELRNKWTYGRVHRSDSEPFLPGMLGVKTLLQAFSNGSWHLGSLGQLPENDALRTIYTELLTLANLAGTFINIPIRTSPELDQLLLWSEDGLLDGFNITSPWQVHLLTKLDQKDPSVVHMKACNTVAITKDGLKGFNTQIEGLKRSLEPFSLKRIKHVYIEGTDRIARSVILALKDHAETIVVRDKLFSQKDQLFYDFPHILPAEESYSEDFDLVVNCTTPEIGFENVVMLPHNIIKNAKIVFDPMSKISSPTPLLQKAKDLNKVFIGGFEFFFNTALSSFEIWTKKSIPPSAIKQEMFDPFHNNIDFGFMLNY